MSTRIVDAARRVRRAASTVLGRGVRDGPRTRRASLRLGSDYGGWSVLPELLEPSSVVYSFGIGQDASWDLELIDRFGVDVHAFDPTPRSVRWVEAQQTPPSFVFHPIGLAAFDGDAHFVMRNPHPGWSSYELGSQDDPERVFDAVDAPVARLSTIAKRLGHDHLDVVKMDVEGAEFAALEDIVANGPLPTQLLVEFHYADRTRTSIDRTARTIRLLNGVGYRVFARSPVGYEFSFVRG